MTASNAAMSATAMLSPTWFGLLGSTNVLMSLATGPKTSSRLGDDSQCATSSTSWVAISLGIGRPSVGGRLCPSCLLGRPGRLLWTLLRSGRRRHSPTGRYGALGNATPKPDAKADREVRRRLA